MYIVRACVSVYVYVCAHLFVYMCERECVCMHLVRGYGRERDFSFLQLWDQRTLIPHGRLLSKSPSPIQSRLRDELSVSLCQTNFTPHVNFINILLSNFWYEIFSNDSLALNFFVERKPNICPILYLLLFSPLKFVNLKFHSIRKHLCHSLMDDLQKFYHRNAKKPYILMLLMFLLCFHFDLFLFSHFVGVSSTSFLEFMCYCHHLSLCHLLQSFSRHIIFHQNINFPAQTSNPSVEKVKTGIKPVSWQRHST